MPWMRTPVGRKSQVATLAGRHNQSEVRQIGLLGRKHPATEAEGLVRFDVARSRQKRLACLAMAIRLLARATFRDPVMPLVAVEKVVCAESDGRCGVILELEKGRAMTGRTTVPIQRAHARADAAHGAAEQPHDLDLVGDLIERDAAALLAVKFIRRDADARGSRCS